MTTTQQQAADLADIFDKSYAMNDAAMRRDDFTCIDLFAGAGGFSTGARMAGGRVLWGAV